VIQKACGGDASRLKAFTAQFRKPVWPGETIRTVGYDLGDGRIVLQAYAGDRPDAVITSAFAEVEVRDNSEDAPMSDEVSKKVLYRFPLRPPMRIDSEWGIKNAEGPVGHRHGRR